MSDLSVPNLFSIGDVISSSKFNANYSAIVNYINDRNSASSSWDLFRVTNNSGVPLTVNNGAGTNSIAQFKDNSTTVCEVKDGGFVDFTGRPVCRASVTLASITLNVATKVNFTSKTFDFNSAMDSNGKFTAPASGMYLIKSGFSNGFSSFGSSHFETIYIYKNGSAISSSVAFMEASLPIPNDTPNLNIMDLLQLNSGDTIEIYLLFAIASGTASVTGSLSVEKVA